MFNYFKKKYYSKNDQESNSQENFDIKALAFTFNLIYVGYSNNGKIDLNCKKIISEYLTTSYNIEDANLYIEKCLNQFSEEYILKTNQFHKKYLSLLLKEEIDELFYQLFKLAVYDRKLLILEFNAIKNVAEFLNYPPSEFNQIIEKNIKHLYLLKETKEYYQYLSYLEVFNAGMSKFDNNEFEDAIKVYDLFLEMINREKLLFGELIDQKLYIEENESSIQGLPLENVYFNRSQCYSNLGQKKEALSDLLKAIDINSEVSSPLLYHHTGCIMFELGDHTNCIEYFDKAIKLDEIESSESYYMRGVAYLSDKCEIQNTNKGLKDLKKYIEFNPKDIKAKKLLDSIESI